MMKHVSPRAELPLVSGPHINNAMPSRVPRPIAKNMTGIYLGSDENRNYPPTRRIVPPLARVRYPTKNSRTPTEEHRNLVCFEDENMTVIYVLPNGLPFTIPNLPSMPSSRYPLMMPQKMVELLRYKEERKGFSGNPVKRRTPSATSVLEPRCQTPDDEDVTIWHLCKQTQRHFTAANNSGVTHLEYLNPDVDGSVTSHDRDAFTVPLSEKVANEVHRLADRPDGAQGLVDCYKKVCKGNLEVLQHLLPMKALKDTPPPPQCYKYTGFSVKSYHSTDMDGMPFSSTASNMARPRTVFTNTPGRPYIPSPYFFKSYSPPQRPIPHRGLHLTSPTPVFDEPRVVAAPGAGVLSRSLTKGHPARPNSPLQAEILQGSSYPPSKME